MITERMRPTGKKYNDDQGKFKEIQIVDTEAREDVREDEI